MSQKPAIFLDRDGVINESPGKGYVRSWNEFKFLPGSLEALRDLSQAGFALFVVSNQSGVARGLYTEEDLRVVNQQMLETVRAAQAGFEAVYYCIHSPEANCSCRKPKTGLIDKAKSCLPIDLPASYVIGDDPKDIALGQQAGIKTILVLSGKTSQAQAGQINPAPDKIFADLQNAAGWILQQ